MIRYLAIASAIVGGVNTALLVYPSGTIPQVVLIVVSVAAAGLAAGSAAVASQAAPVRALLAKITAPDA